MRDRFDPLDILCQPGVLTLLADVREHRQRFRVQAERMPEATWPDREPDEP